MTLPDPRLNITTAEALERLFDAPSESALAKEIGHIDANYRALIEASPFLVLATSGPGGLDCSPRGDKPGFVTVIDESTLVIPDRRGNNRLDSMHNLLSDPRVALLFLIPGLGETLRINGRAAISADPSFLAPYAVDGRAPKVALIVTVEAVFFQCSRAVVRADLWNPAAHVDRASLPSAGKILGDITAQRIDAAKYDKELPARIKSTLY
ncbi:pyridoxamine 5'-phosphate oxidase family protein [Sorangium sp. So ce134]